jgi:putative transposase
LTFEKGLSLYLYLLLDEYSRKAIHWLISWHERALEAKRLVEGGLLSENILDLPEERRPEIINDRRCQMKARPVKEMFETHHMPPNFTRPRTPNDNPYIESAFGTIKQSHRYPGRFLDQNQAIDYFNRFFTWYNNVHYHSGIDYVTPDQCHRGLKDSIVARRKTNHQNQQDFRKEVNRIASLLKNTSVSIYNDHISFMTCSVIPP